MSPAKPFPQEIQWLLKPAGTFLSFDQGPLQARIYKDTGHLELVGPNLTGNGGANVIDFAPPAIQTAAASSTFGRVISSKVIDGGLQIKQALGAAQITSQFIFAHDGVLRYEVVDWADSKPTATAVAAPSD